MDEELSHQKQCCLFVSYKCVLSLKTGTIGECVCVCDETHCSTRRQIHVPANSPFVQSPAKLPYYNTQIE